MKIRRALEARKKRVNHLNRLDDNPLTLPVLRKLAMHRLRRYHHRRRRISGSSNSLILA